MKDRPSREGRWDIWTKKQDVRLLRKGESSGKRGKRTEKRIYTRSERNEGARRWKGGREGKGENRVGEAPKLELIGGGRIAGTNAEGRPQRKRPSGDVTLIPPGRAYKMAAGVSIPSLLFVRDRLPSI